MTGPNHYEALESRLLLDATLLTPGDGASFDFDGDGTDDAVIVNTGAADFSVDIAGSDGLSVDVLGDGAGFVTNTWVDAYDSVADDDFDLNYARIGSGLC